MAEDMKTQIVCMQFIGPPFFINTVKIKPFNVNRKSIDII